MIHGFRYSLGVFRALSDIRRKMSVRSVCNISGLNQTSENVFFPDVSANSVLVFWYVDILGRRNMS